MECPTETKSSRALGSSKGVSTSECEIADQSQAEASLLTRACAVDSSPTDAG